MKWLALLLILLFIAFVVYVILQPPREIVLKDLKPEIVLPSVRNEPAIDTITLIDGIETGSFDKIEVEYFIIIESSKNLTLAQQKAEKYRNSFNTDIFVLPPTAEGNYRISYGKYPTLEEARSNIERVKINFGPNVWIYSKKE